MHSDSAPEDLDELMTEATMPLKMLMERYGKDKESTESSDDPNEGDLLISNNLSRKDSG